MWQIHAFGEGNTRTTAVFTIQYLRSIGFDVSNNMFAQHSWYFRNALVRANYKNAKIGIDYTPIFLERFFRNLLMDEQWELRNRYLYIRPSMELGEQRNLQPQKSTPPSTKDVFSINNERIIQVVRTIGEDKMNIAEILTALHLSDRKNLVKYYLKPAQDEGIVTLLYPDSPRHPRQKYTLTPKGMTLYTNLRQH